jgi:exodeoxyribonuclease VII small subunit
VKKTSAAQAKPSFGRQPSEERQLFGETQSSEGKQVTAGKTRPAAAFEERLARLESLGEKIRGTDVPLDEALKAFEEGIKIARGLEKDLEKIESRIEILMNNTEAAKEESPELELFDEEV